MRRSAINTAMTVVATRFGERVFSPKQLASLTADEVVVVEVPPAANAVGAALTAYSEATNMDRLDQIVKSGDFTEFLLGRLFPDEG